MKLNVLLVHGTWPRGMFSLPSRKARWFEDGSAFQRLLISDLAKQGIEADVTHFPWSGKNSIFARESAAIELAGKLGHDQSEGTHQLMVAHSHGGNMVARALYHLAADARQPLLVTLGTPFMEILPHDRPDRMESALQIISVLPAAIALFVIKAFLPPLTGFVEVAALLAIALFLLGGSYFLSHLLFGSNEGFSLTYKLGRRSAIPSKVERLAEATRLEALTKLGRRLLVLRAVDDEAGMALAAGAIGNKMTSGLVLLTDRHAKTLFFAACIAAAVGFVAKSLLVVVAASVVGLMPFAGFVLLVLAGVFRSCFGIELLFGTAFCEINSQSFPDGSGGAAITLKAPGQTLRHSLTEDVTCPLTIAMWVNRVLPLA